MKRLSKADDLCREGQVSWGCTLVCGKVLRIPVPQVIVVDDVSQLMKVAGHITDANVVDRWRSRS